MPAPREEQRVLAAHRARRQPARHVPVEIDRQLAHDVVAGDRRRVAGRERDGHTRQQQRRGRSPCGGSGRGGGGARPSRTSARRARPGSRARPRRGRCPAPSSRRGRAQTRSRGSPGPARTRRRPSRARRGRGGCAGRRDRLLLPAERRPGGDVAGEQPAAAQIAHDARVAARQRAARGLHVAELRAWPRLRERPGDRRQLTVQPEHGGGPVQRAAAAPRPPPDAPRAAATCS